MWKEGIFLEGHIYQLDINSKVVSASWWLGGCGTYAVKDNPLLQLKNGCSIVNRPIDIYVNGGSAQNGTAWSYDPSLNPVNTETGGMLYIQALNEFQTSQLLDITSDRYLGQDWTQSHEYPFDWYFWGTSVVFMNPKNVSEDIPIIHVSPTDVANNFVPSIWADYPISQTLVTLDGTLRTLYGRQLNIRFDRNAATKAFVLTIFLVNWALTMVVFHITVLSLASKDVKVSEAVLVLPVTVILIIPALRSLFPESPPFGIYIDNVGLFLQMIMVSACSIVLLITSTRSRPTKESHQPQVSKEQTLLDGDGVQVQLPPN